MATEQDKTLNRERVWTMVAMAMTRGIWDLVADSALTLTPQLGLQILEMLEKQLQLSVQGSSPEEIITALGKLCVEGLGFAESANVAANGKTLTLTFSGAEVTSEFHQLQEAGVKKLFSHPFLCCGVAALARIGTKCRGDVQVDPSARSTVITFELL